MNNFSIVFRVIKENCNAAGIPGESCYTALEKLVAGRQLFLPLHLYLEVLQGLSLIKFCFPEHGLILTERGSHTDDSEVHGYKIFILCALYLLRYLLLLLMFWPMLVFNQKPRGEEHKNSAG